MAFVNEYVSQEDIEKYGLDKLFRKYRKNDLKYTATVDPTIKNPTDWTMDRERGIWLKKVANVADPDFEFPSPTREAIFILYYRGTYIEARLWEEYITNNPNEVPYKFAWKFLSMTPETAEGTNYEDLKKILCEALKVYKFGIKSSRSDKAIIDCIDFEGDI